jgi:hypothetical protein
MTPFQRAPYNRNPNTSTRHATLAHTYDAGTSGQWGYRATPAANGAEPLRAGARVATSRRMGEGRAVGVTSHVIRPHRPARFLSSVANAQLTPEPAWAPPACR